MRTAIIGILIFLGWSVGCTYWYVCQIKGQCFEDQAVSGSASLALSPPATSDSTTKVDTAGSANQGHSPKIQQVLPSTETTIPPALQRPFTVLFAFAGPSANEKPALDSYIQEIALHFKQNAKPKVRLQGYTDDTAAKENNLKLSQKRCDAIAELLVYQGIGTDRIISEPLGEANPVATNDTPEGRRLNRRVVISIQDLP